MIEQKGVSFGERGVPRVLELRQKRVRCPAVMLGMTRFMQQSQVIGLSSKRADYKSYLSRNADWRTESSRVLTGPRFVIYENVLLCFCLYPQALHGRAVDIEQACPRKS